VTVGFFPMFLYSFSKTLALFLTEILVTAGFVQLRDINDGWFSVLIVFFPL